MLQWIAASESERNMYFWRLKEPNLIDAEKIIDKLKNETVGTVFHILINYKFDVKNTLFNHILQDF